MQVFGVLLPFSFGFGSLRFWLCCRLHVAALAYGGSNNLCFVSFYWSCTVGCVSHILPCLLTLDQFLALLASLALMCTRVVLCICCLLPCQYCVIDFDSFPWISCRSHAHGGWLVEQRNMMVKIEFYDHSRHMANQNNSQRLKIKNGIRIGIGDIGF